MSDTVINNIYIENVKTQWGR